MNHLEQFDRMLSFVKQVQLCKLERMNSFARLSLHERLELVQETSLKHSKLKSFFESTLFISIESFLNFYCPIKPHDDNFDNQICLLNKAKELGVLPDKIYNAHIAIRKKYKDVTQSSEQISVDKVDEAIQNAFIAHIENINLYYRGRSLGDNFFKELLLHDIDGSLLLESLLDDKKFAFLQSIHKDDSACNLALPKAASDALCDSSQCSSDVAKLLDEISALAHKKNHLIQSLKIKHGEYEKAHSKKCNINTTTQSDSFAIGSHVCNEFKSLNFNNQILSRTQRYATYSEEESDELYKEALDGAKVSIDKIAGEARRKTDQKRIYDGIGDKTEQGFNRECDEEILRDLKSSEFSIYTKYSERKKQIDRGIDTGTTITKLESINELIFRAEHNIVGNLRVKIQEKKNSRSAFASFIRCFQKRCEIQELKTQLDESMRNLSELRQWLEEKIKQDDRLVQVKSAPSPGVYADTSTEIDFKLDEGGQSIIFSKTIQTTTHAATENTKINEEINEEINELSKQIIEINNLIQLKEGKLRPCFDTYFRDMPSVPRDPLGGSSEKFTYEDFYGKYAEKNAKSEIEQRYNQIAQQDSPWLDPQILGRLKSEIARHIEGIGSSSELYTTGTDRLKSVLYQIALKLRGNNAEISQALHFIVNNGDKMNQIVTRASAEETNGEGIARNVVDHVSQIINGLRLHHEMRQISNDVEQVKKDCKLVEEIRVRSPEEKLEILLAYQYEFEPKFYFNFCEKAQFLYTEAALMDPMLCQSGELIILGHISAAHYAYSQGKISLQVLCGLVYIRRDFIPFRMFHDKSISGITILNITEIHDALFLCRALDQKAKDHDLYHHLFNKQGFDERLEEMPHITNLNKDDILEATLFCLQSSELITKLEDMVSFIESDEYTKLKACLEYKSHQNLEKDISHRNLEIDMPTVSCRTKKVVVFRDARVLTPYIDSILGKHLNYEYSEEDSKSGVFYNILKKIYQAKETKDYANRLDNEIAKLNYLSRIIGHVYTTEAEIKYAKQEHERHSEASRKHPTNVSKVMHQKERLRDAIRKCEDPDRREELRRDLWSLSDNDSPFIWYTVKPKEMHRILEKELNTGNEQDTSGKTDHLRFLAKFQQDMSKLIEAKRSHYFSSEFYGYRYNIDSDMAEQIENWIYRDEKYAQTQLRVFVDTFKKHEGNMCLVLKRSCERYSLEEGSSEQFLSIPMSNDLPCSSASLGGGESGTIQKHLLDVINPLYRDLPDNYPPAGPVSGARATRIR